MSGPSGAVNGVLNAMTVDVEEHFQVSAFEGCVRRDSWDSLPSRVEDNTRRTLDLLDEAGVRGTFFVLGWIGDRHPRLVRLIAERGHEIGSHGYDHKLLYDLDPEQARRETVLSKRILEDAGARPVRGYRSASFSIRRGNLWALDLIAEAGFEYDSSIFPVVHDRYGMPGTPRSIYRLRTPGGSTLVEFPPSTLAIGRMTFPVAGGGYLRIWPARLTRFALDRLNHREGIPAMVYFHPWELDPGQPRFRTTRLTRFRHYTGLRKTAKRLRMLMGRYAFGAVEDVIRKNGVGELFSLDSGGRAVRLEERS